MGDQVTDTERMARARASFTAMNASAAQFYRDVYAIDTTPGSVPGARPRLEAVTFPRHARGVSNPRAIVEAARALVEDLPNLGKAFSDGLVTKEHVAVAVRTLNRIPRHLLDGNGLAKIDSWFTETSLDLAPVQTEVAARHLLQVLDPHGGDTFDPHALDRRELTTAGDATGMVALSGHPAPATGARLRAALDPFPKPQPADKTSQLPVPDARS